MTRNQVERLDEAAHRRWLAALLAAAAAVVAWKVAALVLIERGRAEGSALPAIPTLLSLAGLVFVVCGLLVLWRRPSRAALIFAGFALCAGLHWGGPLELAAGPWRTGLILLYLLISGVLAACLLLHFALVFPRPLLGPRQRSAIRALYAPLVLASVLAAAAVFGPGPDLRQTATSGFLLVHTLVSNLLSAGALAIFIARLVRPGLDRRRKLDLALLVAGMLIAWLPYLVVSSLGVEADAWNLTVVALPIAATLAILGSLERRPGEG